MKTRAILLVLCTTLTNGCATYTSLLHRESGDPLIMSGTRMNVVSVSIGPDHNGRKMIAHPILDFPFSLVGDVMVLGITLPSALASKVVE